MPYYVLIILLVFGILILVRPYLGLYLFFFTLIFLPSDFRIGRFSPNLLLILSSLVGVFFNFILKANFRRKSKLFPPFLIIFFISLINYYIFPYRTSQISGFNVPYILFESLIVFGISFFSLNKKINIENAIITLTCAYVLRNSYDIVLAILGFGSSDLGLIRNQQLTMGIDVTALAAWQAIFFPLSIIGISYFKGFKKLLFVISLLTNVIWMSMSYTRSGFLGILVSSIFLLKEKSKLGIKLNIIFPIIGFTFMIFILIKINALQFLLEKTFLQFEVEVMNETGHGRIGAMTDAFFAWLKNPIFGGLPGPAHSYILGAARYMGLVFLVPFIYIYYRISKDSNILLKLNYQNVDDLYVKILLLGKILVPTSLVLNFFGALNQSAWSAFTFWYLIGIHQSIVYKLKSKISV